MHEEVEKPEGQDKHRHYPNHKDCTYGSLFFIFHRSFPPSGESKKAMRGHVSRGVKSLYTRFGGRFQAGCLGKTDLLLWPDPGLQAYLTQLLAGLVVTREIRSIVASDNLMPAQKSQGSAATVYRIPPGQFGAFIGYQMCLSSSPARCLERCTKMEPSRLRNPPRSERGYLLLTPIAQHVALQQCHQSVHGDAQ